MRVSMLAPVFLALALPTAAYSQVVCQVIEVMLCAPVPVKLCPDLMECTFDPAWPDYQCTGKGQVPTHDSYYGLRPANLGEPGFVFANHVGSVWCKQERACHHNCVKHGEFVFYWKCQWDGDASWTNAGTEYVELQGAGPCVGS